MLKRPEEHKSSLRLTLCKLYDGDIAVGGLIQTAGGQGVLRRLRFPRTRHDVIKPAMLACILGVVAGVAMLAYGNFGRPSTVAAATTPETLRIVAAPLDSSSPLPTGVETRARADTGAAAVMASTETLVSADPNSDPITPQPASVASQDPQMADDAAAAGMTAHVRADSATLG